MLSVTGCSAARQAPQCLRTLRRPFEIACAATGLALLVPVFLAVAGIILWNDGWPIFFSQWRVGRRGRFFRMWKFRTMRACSNGAVITAAGDRRVTRVGGVLRRYKLDELPQLYNVLKGEMSLVGPRPEVPECVQLEAPIWQAVLQAPPGITDPASLLYRDEEKLLSSAGDIVEVYRTTILPRKLALNLRYMQARSFWKDLRLICLTLRYSLFPAHFDPDHVARKFGLGM